MERYPLMNQRLPAHPKTWGAPEFAVLNFCEIRLRITELLAHHSNRKPMQAVRTDDLRGPLERRAGSPLVVSAASESGC